MPSRSKHLFLFAHAVVACAHSLIFLVQRPRNRIKRRLFAVSGTLQNGFQLRKNLDFGGIDAIFVGHALVVGVKMYFDVKPTGCREHISDNNEKRPNMNPCLLCTNDLNDGNVYHIFAVTETALCEALCNEPRYLGVTPDCVKIDLYAKETSESVRVAAFGEGYDITDKSKERKDSEGRRYGTMLTVVAYGIPRKRAVEATPGYVKEDGCRVTTFKECSEDTFGPEVTPFTTRDDSIRRARERRVPNEEEEEDAMTASAALPMLNEALYGAASKNSPRLIDRMAADRAIAFIQRTKRIDGGYFATT